MLPFGRALVTGGAGFVGSHIVDLLVKEGCEVVVLDDFSAGRMDNVKESMTTNRVKIVKGSINNREVVKESLKDIDIVFHEAAIVSVQRSINEPDLTTQVNVDGTSCLLNCSADAAVQKFIFASTAAVYGLSKVLPRREESEASPISPYGVSKFQAEKLCFHIHSERGLGTTILRYFNIYGARSTSKLYIGAINIFAQRLIARQSPIVYGDGKQTRDFISVNDIVEANVRVATNQFCSGRLFLVGTGVRTSVEDLLKLESLILLGAESVIPIEYQPAREGDVHDNYADITQIRNFVGFEPKVELQPGLSEYFRWLFPTRKLYSVKKEGIV